MKEIPLTKGKVAIVDDDDYEYLRQFKWYYADRYAARGQWIGDIRYSNGKQKLKTIRMHRVIMNTPGGMETDHINGNKLDNRKENLRICTGVQNRRNRVKYKNNSIGYKGVFIKKKHKNKTFESICAQICVNKKIIHLGTFKTPEEAAKAYNEAAIKYYGEFAQLNEVAI
jgi:hypothetical protein